MLGSCERAEQTGILVPSLRALGPRCVTRFTTRPCPPPQLCAHINALNGSGDGKQNGFQSDMYAFGVTMVELFGLSINHLHGIQGKAGKTGTYSLCVCKARSPEATGKSY